MEHNAMGQSAHLQRMENLLSESFVPCCVSLKHLIRTQTLDESWMGYLDSTFRQDAMESLGHVIQSMLLSALPRCFDLPGVL